MRSSAPLLALATAAVLAACNGRTNSPPKATLCPPGQVVSPSGTCLVADAGTTIATCTAADKPIGTSTASEQQHLGTFTVGQTVPFDVPANIASVTIVEQAVSAPDSVTVLDTNFSPAPFAVDNTAVPLIVKDPSGNTIYDDRVAPADPTAVPVFFASSSPATGTLTLPNTTKGLTQFSAGVPAGSSAGGNPWTVTVSDYAYECTQPLPPGQSCPTGGSTASTYDVTVITKPNANGAIPTSGKLDVNIYFATTQAPDQQTGVTTKPLSANTASTDPDLTRMVQTLGTIMSNAGITVNSVVFKDLPADVQARYATGVDVDQTGACGPLSQLLKFADKGNTMNIFFVSSFQATGLSAGNTVVGIDGTIPGPSTIGGTVASGAAVATHDLRFNSGTAACAGALSINCGADVTAYIVAHETGHFLGLYHVTESEGTFFDPLTGTPPCPCSTCKAATATDKCIDATPAPAAGTEHPMSVAECTVNTTTCGGGDNLMFWILETGSLGTLVDEQARVMRANPLIQ